MADLRPRTDSPRLPRRLPVLVVVSIIMLLLAAWAVFSGDSAPKRPGAGNRETVGAAPSADGTSGVSAPSGAIGSDGAGTLAAPGGGGYVITAADAKMLANTPLREGDVLLEVDGQKLDAARFSRLAEEVSELEAVWVSLERNGQRQDVLLELRER